MKYLSKLLIKNVEIISAPDNEKYFLGIDNDTISVISKEMPTGFENAEIINFTKGISSYIPKTKRPVSILRIRPFFHNLIYLT